MSETSSSSITFASMPVKEPAVVYYMIKFIGVKRETYFEAEDVLNIMLDNGDPYALVALENDEHRPFHLMVGSEQRALDRERKDVYIIFGLLLEDSPVSRDSQDTDIMLGYVAEMLDIDDDVEQYVSMFTEPTVITWCIGIVDDMERVATYGDYLS